MLSKMQSRIQSGRFGRKGQSRCYDISVFEDCERPTHSLRTLPQGRWKIAARQQIPDSRLCKGGHDRTCRHWWHRSVRKARPVYHVHLIRRTVRCFLRPSIKGLD